VPRKKISTLNKILSLLVNETGQKAIREVKQWPALADLEKAYVAQVLLHTKGNKQAATRILNIDRKRLDRMIKRYELSVSAARAGTEPI
jgi:DNA-binding NtrC family response regulator